MFGLRMGAMGRVGAGLTLTQQAINNGLAVLRQYGTDGHMLWPGVGIISGQDVANFKFADGTVSAAVDEINGVGYVGDVGKALGSELVAASSTWTQPAGVTVNVGASTVSFSGAQSAFASSNLGSITTVVGRAYSVTYTVSGVTQGSAHLKFGPTDNYRNANGTYSLVVIASAGTTPLIAQDNGSSGSRFIGTVSNISVKELVGAIPATQGTTAAKPTLRRGAVNRLLNSATLSTQTRAVNAVTYTLHFTGTGTVTLSGASTAGPLIGTGVSNRVSLTFTPTAGNLTLTVTGTVTEAMMETGSVASPYVPAGAAAASSPTGPYWWEFDGSDDRLSLASVPFQQADDHVVVTAAAAQSSTGDRVLYAQRSTAATQPLAPFFRVSSAGELAALYRDDSGTPTITVAGGTVAVGETFVATARRSGGVRTVRKNGVAGASNSTVFGTTTLNAAVIGASTTTTTANFWVGPIYPVAIVKANVPDDHVIAIERMIAALSGVSL